MRRRELSTRIGQKLGVAAAVVDRVLDATVDLLLEELVTTGRFEWRGFGTFTVRTYRARQIHNPSTRKVVGLHARRGVAFKVGRRLRTLLAARTKREKTARGAQAKGPQGKSTGASRKKAALKREVPSRRRRR